MSKLDEIEARVKRETGLGATEWLGPSATAVELEDVSLLVRAVQQLGKLYGTTYTMSEQAEMIDPDVLALLKEEA